MLLPIEIEYYFDDFLFNVIAWNEEATHVSLTKELSSFRKVVNAYKIPSLCNGGRKMKFKFL